MKKFGLRKASYVEKNAPNPRPLKKLKYSVDEKLLHAKIEDLNSNLSLLSPPLRPELFAMSRSNSAPDVFHTLSPPAPSMKSPLDNTVSTKTEDPILFPVPCPPKSAALPQRGSRSERSLRPLDSPFRVNIPGQRQQQQQQTIQLQLQQPEPLKKRSLLQKPKPTQQPGSLQEAQKPVTQQLQSPTGQPLRPLRTQQNAHQPPQSQSHRFVFSRTQSNLESKAPRMPLKLGVTSPAQNTPVPDGSKNSIQRSKSAPILFLRYLQKVFALLTYLGSRTKGLP